jgi:hypothetical protein
MVQCNSALLQELCRQPIVFRPQEITDSTIQTRTTSVIWVESTSTWAAQGVSVTGNSPDNRILRRKEKKMPARNPRGIFLMLLSNARQNTEWADDVYQEISQAAEKPDVHEALGSRAFGEKGEPFYERQQH